MTGEGLEGKLAIFRDNILQLDNLAKLSFEEFVGDVRNADSALHRLQTSIQVLIDVGSYVCAQRGLGAPASSRGLLEILEGAEALPAGSVARFGPIFGFRNRVVHLYERVDLRIVYRILRDNREDLTALLSYLLDLLEPTLDATPS